MNAADVPFGVTTVTSTVPEPAGLASVISSAVSADEAGHLDGPEIHGGGAGEVRAGDRHCRCRPSLVPCSGTIPVTSGGGSAAT